MRRPGPVPALVKVSLWNTSEKGKERERAMDTKRETQRDKSERRWEKCEALI